jgi:endoglycosylceramidase
MKRGTQFLLLLAVAAAFAGAVACGASSTSSAGAPKADDDQSPDDDSADDDQSPVPAKIESAGQWYIADEYGRALFLHGCNVTDDTGEWSWTPAWGAVSQADFESMAELGFNFVRLQRFWGSLEPTEGQYDEAYFDRAQELLDICQNLGIRVVLDNHQDTYSPATGGRGAPQWAVRMAPYHYTSLNLGFLGFLGNIEPAVLQSWQSFWDDADLQQRYIAMLQEYARRFGNHPAVIGYDLLNEPFQGWELLRVQEWEATVLTSTYQKWIDAIREVDQRNWIFYEGVSWIVNGSFLPSHVGPMKEDKAVYFPHMYDFLVSSNLPWNGDPAFIYTWEGRALDRAAVQQAPLMCGEFGMNPDIAGQNAYLWQSLQMFNRSLSGWAYWEWGYVSQHLAAEDQKPSYKTYIDELAQPYPRAIAGAPLAIRLARDPATLEIEFLPDPRVAAPTEIFISSKRWFPNGFVVTSTDPDGAWSYTYDQAHDVLSVTGDRHAAWTQITVAPK